jgi:hypothetical protein
MTALVECGSMGRSSWKLYRNLFYDYQVFDVRYPLP